MEFNLQDFDYTNIASYYDILIAFWISFVPKFVWAILVLMIGFKVANMIWNAVERYFAKAQFDPTVERFVVNILKVALKVMVVVAVVGILWVQTSSFVALFAAAGFALGGALSGTLWHFASGIVILWFRPFKIWDLVEIQWHTGTVIDISIFSTKIQTVDTTVVIVPNSDAIGGSIVNYSMKDERQIDMLVGIWYSDDIDYAREVLTRIASENDKAIINEDKPVKVIVKELWDNAVTLALRVWTTTDDYWAMKWELVETVKKEFDKTKWKLNFPFPQRDVHHYYETAPITPSSK